MIERFFHLTENGTTIRTEIAAGVTTYLTMAYIAFVNPAVVITLAIPLTFSIVNGIALGFILYVAVKLLSGRAAEAGPAMSVLAALFVVKYAFF